LLSIFAIWCLLLLRSSDKPGAALGHATV